MSQTTPLLMSQGYAFPGAGAFPAAGAYPGQFPGAMAQQQQYAPNPYQVYQRYGAMGAHQPDTSASNPKHITHSGDLGKDPHSQFCALTGCPPTNAPPDFRYKLNEKTLYGRAVEQVQNQNLIYQFTAATTNILLLAQIVLGAALTGLGGANVPSYVITIFGATNTVIAGLVAYLKSRGQPMRARMFRDDLERVVDEIENSEVMWLGIAKNVHGYTDIDTDGEVTVRSEVARLTRLLDKAIKTNSANVPEMYNAGATDSGGSGSGMRQGAPFMNFAAMGGMPMDPNAMANIPSMKVDDADESPATAMKKKKDEEDKKKKAEADKAAADKKNATSTPAPASSGAAPPSTSQSTGGQGGNTSNSSNTQTSTTTSSGGDGQSSTTKQTSSSSTSKNTSEQQNSSTSGAGSGAKLEED